MANATKTRSKADIVREILNNLGAVSDEPPEGWKVAAEKELKKRKLKVHQTQIYEIRRKELAKQQAASGEAPATPTRRRRRRKPQVEKLNFDAAVKIAKFAAPYGGLAKLRGHIDKIMALTGELK